uniref:Protein kinase domain-containing protein n=1 Tax=Denticeps clupeoides TaxID=299321 RepID=A0AAY4E7G2_9TELE
MEEEEHTDRQLQIAELCKKLQKIKRNINDDDTDNINQIITLNSPETCLTYLRNLEKKGDPRMDHSLLNKLIDCYTQVFSSMPLGKYCQNPCYARMLVRFAELKAIQDVSEAQDNFHVARSHCQEFAFVHIAHAQFELSQGNIKKSTWILQRALQLKAKPTECLEAAMQNLKLGRSRLFSQENKENTIDLGSPNDLDPFTFRTDQRNNSAGHEMPYWRSSANRKRAVAMVEYGPLCHIIITANCNLIVFPACLYHTRVLLFCEICISLLDSTCSVNQVLCSKSPELCMTYLTNLEKAGDPRLDSTLLAKLLDSYSRVFARLALEKYSKNECYARMLVKFAELKVYVSLTHMLCINVCVVGTFKKNNNKILVNLHLHHILLIGNVKKSYAILQKAIECNAKPTELLHTAMKNMQSGKKQLLLVEDKENITEVNRCQISLNQVQQKPTFKDSPSEWKIPARINRYVSPEVTVAPHTVQNMSHAPFLCTPQSKVSYVQAPLQTPIFSNDTITIKGRQFFILKMIGRGGSSKVYQVLDHRKQLYAVKYVNLEEADAQTVESYKNEIEYLNHLQQYSEQIIKLHDYEITNNCIYMLMECGNLDLNTWLRNRKSVNPLERKFYWRNMLEAVHTIHKHGIIHSDLKPANFVIVNASLKLIDFGIANRIQPDMTSIVKDSQVGTLNYMPPEAIKDTSSKAGHPSSKISPKGDVWSLGCILYCMTYGKTPFQSITNQMSKLHAIIDPSHEIDFPNIAEQDLLDVLTRCLVRNPKERISIAELLEHPYLQIQPQQQPEPAQPCSGDLKRILNELAALQSPNSIARAASNLAKMCNSGKKLDISECVKTSSQTSWKM